MEKENKKFDIGALLFVACFWAVSMAGASLLPYLVRGEPLKEAVAKSPIGSWQGWLIYGAAGLLVSFAIQILPSLIKRRKL